MKKLKIRRVIAGLSQSELAKQLGVSQAAVSAWECGISQPTSKQLPLIAAALNCSIDELFGVET